MWGWGRPPPPPHTHSCSSGFAAGWFPSVAVLRGVCGFRQVGGGGDDDNNSTLPQKLLRRGGAGNRFPGTIPGGACLGGRMGVRGRSQPLLTLQVLPRCGKRRGLFLVVWGFLTAGLKSHPRWWHRGQMRGREGARGSSPPRTVPVLVDTLRCRSPTPGGALSAGLTPAVATWDRTPPPLSLRPPGGGVCGVVFAAVRVPAAAVGPAADPPSPPHAPPRAGGERAAGSFAEAGGHAGAPRAVFKDNKVFFVPFSA